MVDIEVEFRVPCGLLEPAQRVQAALFSEFGEGLDAVALVPGDGGVFEVRVDGEEVHDGRREVPDEDELFAEVRQRSTEEALA